MLSRMSITRTLLLIAGILWVVSALLLTLGQRQDNAEIALPLPPTPVPQLHDQVPLKPDAWGENGSPYLINIWASWCVSCRAENIHLKRLKDAGIRIVGINYQDDRETAQAWLARYGSPFELVLSDDDGSYAAAMGVKTAPETLIVDAEGVVRFHYQGQVDDLVWEKRLAPIYNSLLAVTP
ncbi:MAG: DsbE family thiol:disulfide interchange protein [Cellvibrionales bacterium]